MFSFFSSKEEGSDSIWSHIPVPFPLHVGLTIKSYAFVVAKAVRFAPDIVA